jgi:phage replication initiation protein
MSGQGCREYETYGVKDWCQFFEDALLSGGTFTRLDGAIDDIVYDGQAPYFTLNRLYRKTREGCVRSRFKRGKYVQSLLLEDGSSLGETLYFGREQSDIQIRFYEKDYEREEAGETLEEGIIVWNRTEIQCRRDRAHVLAHYLVEREDFGTVLAGVLKNYLNFLVKGKDTNKARWEVCEWWNEFLGDVEKLRLTLIAPDKTIERAITWIDKQVSPTLGMIFAAVDGDIDKIMQFVQDGMDRLTKEQIALAKEYSDDVAEKKKDQEYKRRNMWQDYLFKTGAHREEYVEKKPPIPEAETTTMA